MQRSWFAACAALWMVVPGGLRAAEPGTAAQAKAAMPAYRVETDGFDASEADIRAVLDSAGGELWRFFPDYQLEPFVVTRGHDDPITLFQRNDRSEIVMRLNTEKTYWSQYAYQFAHEFCHVLCGFRDGYQGNKWFEETVCETASLFAMRAMARSWKKSPPYPHWADYRDSLREYTDDIMRRRERIHDVFAGGLPAFVRAHRETLERTPTSRDLNGAMSLVLLQLLEERPERWEAVRWLNHAPAQPGDDLGAYMRKWHDAAPPRHRPLVKQLAGLFGAPLSE
jgi:hypothetical protein